MFLTEEVIRNISEEEIQFLAAQKYNEGKTLKQFYEDWARIGYIRKLLGRRRKCVTSFNPRLFLNHIVILNNIFGPKLTSVILFCKTQEDDWPVVKSALLVLAYMTLEEMPNTDPDVEAWKEFKYQ